MTYRGLMQVPKPTDPEESERWNHTRLRRSILDGMHRKHLEQRRTDMIGSIRSAAWGPVDMAANPFANITTELSTLYLAAPPAIRHDDMDTAALEAAVSESGLWASMTRFQSWVIGCREYLMRVHATEDGKLRYRAVAPDLVLAEANPETPDIPWKIRELRIREDKSAKEGLIWAWDELDISDPNNPTYRVVADKGMRDGRGGEDLTERYLGGPQSGDDYPYRRADGRPILPYVMYHAERLGDRLWDWLRAIELVDGTLTLGVMRSFWLHTVQDASWPQRYGINLRVAGLTTIDESQREARLEIITDPATFLSFEVIDPDRPASAGQFSAGGDPEKLLAAIQSWAAWLAHDAGISGTDLLRTSGDPRSGYALSLSNEGKRSAQRRYGPQFSRPDQQLMEVSAVLLNAATGSSLPENGYNITYSAIPLSPEEMRERRANVIELVEAGLMSRLDAYTELHPGITESQAAEELRKIDVEAKERMELFGAPSNQPNDKPSNEQEQEQGENNGGRPE